jgi:hypothetical protein
MYFKSHLQSLSYARFFPPRNLISYVGGPCSSGKTRQTCAYIKERIYETNYVYVAPSNRLAEQTAADLRARGLSVLVINSSSHPRKVRRQIIKAMKEAFEFGVVLIVTWQAYVGLSYVPEEKDFQVIIDEIPQLDRFYAIRLLPENVEQISKWVDIASSENEHIGAVEARDEDKLQRYLEAEDDINSEAIQILRDVASPNQSVYVDLKSWNGVIEKRKKGKTDAEKTVYFVALLKPDFLYKSIMLGANFENSLLHFPFKKHHDVRFKEFTEISQRLRAVETGSRDIEVCYFLEDSYFSKSKGRKPVGEDGTLIEIMDKEAVSYFGDEKFLYVANNDRNSPVLEATPKARRISVQSHGLNCYDKHHNIYFSAALNRQPQHFKMLDHFGFDAAHVHSATAHEVVYQNAMRLSLRRPEATHPVRIIVPDRYTANRVAELLGVKEITRIGDIDLKRREPLSPSQRNRKSKTKKLVQDLFGPNRLRFSLKDEKSHQNGAKSDLISKASNLNTCFLTFHKSVDALCEEEFIENELEWQDFIKFLRQHSKTPVKNKGKDTFLFNPAIFDPAIDKSGYRKKANFVGSCMLVLDFDNGNLSPDEFEDIFWNKAGKGQKRSFIICNSFSRSPEQPNRFRVMFLYKKPALSIAEHEAVFNSIVERLEGEGFTVKEMCLDTQCKTGVQSFFMPCTNLAHPDYAFFRTHGTKTTEIERYGIDPSTYLRTAKPEKPWTRRPYTGDVPEDLSPELQEMKATLMGMKEGRHELFYEFARRLAFHFKGDGSLVERHLDDVAGTDPKMKRKVKGYLQSLEKAGWI